MRAWRPGSISARSFSRLANKFLTHLILNGERSRLFKLYRPLSAIV